MDNDTAAEPATESGGRGSGSGGTTAPNGKRRRKHRRGKKKFRRDQDKEPAASSDSGSCLAGDEADDKDTEVAAAPSLAMATRVIHRSRRSKRPVLRPLRVPCAPKNSTQFIMDDHENSSLFQSFDQPPREDQDFWDAYSLREFEQAYRSTREEALLTWSHEALVAEMHVLEQRAEELEQQLSLSDPPALMAKLQEQLLQLQEENRMLREQNACCQLHNGRREQKEDSERSSGEVEDCPRESEEYEEEEEYEGIQEVEDCPRESEEYEEEEEYEGIQEVEDCPQELEKEEKEGENEGIQEDVEDCSQKSEEMETERCEGIRGEEKCKETREEFVVQ